MLIITQIPAAHCSPEEDQLSGQNRFECRTCPYQMVLDRRYYERKTMKLKAVEDILGGADSWKNVDQTEGEPLYGITLYYVLTFFVSSEMRQRELRQPHGILPTSADSQCRRAHDEFLQMRQVHSRMEGELRGCGNLSVITSEALPARPPGYGWHGAVLFFSQ